MRNAIYKCKCGNIVEMVIKGEGELSCCGSPMKVLEEKTDLEGLGQKHVPLVDSNSKTKVRMGRVEHPMHEDHYIQFVELLNEDELHRIYLKPGQEPEAVFEVVGNFTAREYCNLHGLWKKE